MVTFFIINEAGKRRRCKKGYYQRKEEERIPKPGTQVEYNGKKYVSLKELSKDIDVPYSPLMHRYYRSGDIEDAVAWASDTKEKKKSYVLWNRQYENLNCIALAFGLNPGSIYARLKENDSLEDIVSGLLQKETITFHGMEKNITIFPHWLLHIITIHPLYLTD